MKYIYIFALAVCLVFYSHVADSYAATFTVDTTLDTIDANVGDGFCLDRDRQCSLRAAISEANADVKNSHVINLSPGVYTNDLVAANEDNNAGGDWDINSNIVILGTDRDFTILQSGWGFDVGTERVLHLLGENNLVKLINLTVRNGVQKGHASTIAGQGGGIFNAGRLQLFNTLVSFNVAEAGSGIYAPRHLELYNSVIFANYGRASGLGHGGGILMKHDAQFSLRITDSGIIGNSAIGGQTQGGGISVEGTGTGEVKIENTTFRSNTSQSGSVGYGSGLFVAASGGHTTLNLLKTNFYLSEFIGGTQHYGTAMFVGTSISSATITGTIDRANFQDNTGVNGGALAVSAAFGSVDLAVDNSLFKNNRARKGAAIAVYNIGPDPNSTTTVTVTNSTLSANIGRFIGGGAYVESSGAGTANLNFNFATLTENTAGSVTPATSGGGGGGIYRVSGNVNMKNSVVAGNTVTGAQDAAPDISGTVNSLGFNHIGDLTGATVTGQTANNTLGDPLLGGLTENGGETLTHLPFASSPLVNSVPFSECNINRDQRGDVRPQGSGCDRGAVELGEFPAANVTGTVHTADGIPIRNIYVTLDGPNLQQPVTVLTGSFGGFAFNNVPYGEYTIVVASKRYTFSPDAIQFGLMGTDVHFDFIAEP